MRCNIHSKHTQSVYALTAATLAANRILTVCVLLCFVCFRSINAFGLEGTFDYVDAISAWDDCIAELDYRKNVTNTPDMKMVVSMSWGSDGNIGVVADYLKKVYAQRPDILWIAAAGNDNNNTEPMYPAMSPEVVSVSAVDWNGNKASFSNYGPTIEW
jgi:hypothetical protein